MRLCHAALLLLPISLAFSQPVLAEGKRTAEQMAASANAHEQVSSNQVAVNDAELVKQRFMISRQLEAEQEARLLTLLDKLFGAGKALVSVKMDLEFSQRTTHSLLKAPVTNNGKLVFGDRMTSADKSTREETAFNLEDSTLVIAPGSLRRLSVAVALPSESSAQNMERVRGFIAAAVGADPARRDQVTVERFVSSPARSEVTSIRR